MNAAYTQTLVVLLATIAVPAGALTWLLRPRSWKQVFRGGEVAICLAFTINAARQLFVIGSGTPVAYPGVIVGTINFSLLALITCLIWARVIQVARHGLKNKEAARVGIENLRAMGVDVSAYDARKRK